MFYDSKDISKHISSADRSLEKQTRKLFEILVRENSRMLSAYLRSLLRDNSVVDDLFQETMVVAWRRIDECDLQRPFGPWLRGIASRLVLAHYRNQKSAPVLLNESVLQIIDQQFENFSALAGDTWEDKLAALHECLDALPARQKEVIQGRYFDHLSASEVAERSGVTLEACKKRLQRGRSLLARCLKTKGVFSASGAAP